MIILQQLWLFIRGSLLLNIVRIICIYLQITWGFKKNETGKSAQESIQLKLIDVAKE